MKSYAKQLLYFGSVALILIFQKIDVLVRNWFSTELCDFDLLISEKTFVVNSKKIRATQAKQTKVLKKDCM